MEMLKYLFLSLASRQGLESLNLRVASFVLLLGSEFLHIGLE